MLRFNYLYIIANDMKVYHLSENRAESEHAFSSMQDESAKGRDESNRY